MRRSSTLREKLKRAARWLDQALRGLTAPREPALAPVPVAPRRPRPSRR